VLFSTHWLYEERIQHGDGDIETSRSHQNGNCLSITFTVQFVGFANFVADIFYVAIL